MTILTTERAGPQIPQPLNCTYCNEHTHLDRRMFQWWGTLCFSIGSGAVALLAQDWFVLGSGLIGFAISFAGFNVAKARFAQLLRRHQVEVRNK
jgi:hypothetical protein